MVDRSGKMVYYVNHLIQIMNHNEEFSMNAITLHAIDDTLYAALRKYATETEESLNRAAKSLLARALCVRTEEHPVPGFMRFAGSLSFRDADAMRKFVSTAEFSKVDPKEWK